MKKIVFLLILAFLIGCNNDSKTGSNITTPVAPTRKINNIMDVKLVGGTNAKSKFMTKGQITNQAINALTIAELEVVAYQYNPGQNQPYTYFGSGIDWSYYVLCQQGVKSHQAIQSGQILDLSTFNTTESKDMIEAAAEIFAKTSPSFSIDFLEVNMLDPGIIINNNYYGRDCSITSEIGTVSTYYFNTIDSYPANYPDLYSLLVPNFVFDIGIDTPGINFCRSVDIIFARSDWFPISIVVEAILLSTPEGHSYKLGNMSTSLTQDQETKILSLLNNGTKTRFYGTLFIIPYTHVELAVALDAPGLTNPEATIEFNFNWDNLLAQETIDKLNTNGTLTDVDMLKFKTTNNVPMGISIKIVDLDDIK